jgi:hypothetical protein
MSARGQTYTIIEGASEPVDVSLLNDGAALVGTGLDVSLSIRAVSPAELPDTLPTVAWLSQAGGTVRLTGMEALGLGTYKVRFVLTDESEGEGYAPNGGEPDTWRVVRA